MSITASEARKNLFPLIEKVNDDRTPLELTSRRGDAVLLSRADYEALEETAHLLRVPANAKRLIESLQQALSGQREEHDLAQCGSSSPPTAGTTTPIGSQPTAPPSSGSTG